MSAGSRQEVLTSSLIEGLCLIIEKHYHDKPRHKVKLETTERLFKAVVDYWQAYPIQLPARGCEY